MVSIALARAGVQLGFRFAGPSSSPAGQGNWFGAAPGGPTEELRATTGLRATELAADLEAGARPAELAVGGDAEDLLIHDDFVAVAAGAATPKGRRTVVVARALDVVGDATRVVTGLLALGLPALLLIVTVTTWKVVGRALAPVEAVPAEVDRISPPLRRRRLPRAALPRPRRSHRAAPDPYNPGDNAARHASSRVRFTLDERDGAAVLAVDDDGGSGLGLAIVAELAGAHGGAVAVASSPLGGACIEVTLPAAGR